MIVLFNIKIKNYQNIKQGLMNIFGINNLIAKNCMKKLGLNFCKNYDFENLSKEELLDLKEYIELNFKVETSLKKEVRKYKSIILKSNSYRANRLKKGLPANGQRTHTNAKTSKKLKLS